jgi:hypothetical protein
MSGFDDATSADGSDAGGAKAVAGTDQADGITISPEDAPLGDTTVGDTAAADAEFEGRPLTDGADEEQTYVDPDVQPESQGDDPVVAELGEEGEGDLSPEDI